jgi:predicted  nucleic acid-binding Zn-ribbon protein
MGIRLDKVTVLCDDTCKACLHRCSAVTTAVLEPKGIKVELPSGWTQDGDRLFGVNCSEERALRKVHDAEMPDPSKVDPQFRAQSEHAKELMRPVVRDALREDLEEEAEEDERVREMDESVLQGLRIVDGGDDEPDFRGRIGNTMAVTEVRVRGEFVRITWPGSSDVELELRHENFELVKVPPFLAAEVVTWVQNGLKTMKGQPVRRADGHLAAH